MATGIGFEDLYGDDKTQASSLFLVHTQDILDGFGAEAIPVDDQIALPKFITGLSRASFPAKGGYDCASPFKKASFLYVSLHQLNPFTETLNHGSEAVSGISEFPHSTATLIGFTLVQRCLLGATVERKDGQRFVLKNPIKVSDHFFKDLVEASSGITLVGHFRTYALLFESLAYNSNSQVPYDRELSIEEEWAEAQREYPSWVTM